MSIEIQEEQIQGLNNKPPKFKAKKYPVPINPNVPAPYFICCAIGQRGQGKSFSIVKLLKNIIDSGLVCPITGEKCDIRVIIFCPTMEGNPIYTALGDNLDEDDIIPEYTDQKLYDVLEDIKAYNDEYKKYMEYVEAYKKYEKMSDADLAKCTDYEFLGLLYSQNFIDYRKLQKVKPRVNYIVLDDCLASKEAFSSKKSSVLTRAVLNSRHLGCNIIVAGQSIRAISKPIRLNTDIWVLYRFKNDKILLSDIYEEISAEVSPDEFLALYHFSTEEDHSALVYDGKAEKGKRFKKNFDKILHWK